MKTVMRKCGVYAVWAVTLLVATMLVTACLDDPAGSVYTPPAGMGAVRLNLSLDNPARATILPGTATITSFQRFYLNFTPTALGAAKQEYYTYAQLGTGNPIDLVPGTYTLEVIGYLDAGTPPATTPVTTPPAQPAATATVTGIVVASGSSGTQAVVLRAYDPDLNTGNGTFAWNITNSVTGLDTAEMTVTRIGAGTPASYGPYDLMDGTAPNIWVNTAGVTVSEGFYYVDFVLEAGALTRNFRHILHVYRNYTSTFTYAFTNDKLGIVSTTLAVTVTYVHPSELRPDVRRDATPTPVALADDAIVTVSIGSSDTEDLLVDNASAYASIVWWCDGVSLETGADFTVDVADSPFDVKGTYCLTVIGTTPAGSGAYDGSPFSAVIYIKVVD